MSPTKEAPSFQYNVVGGCAWACGGEVGGGGVVRGCKPSWGRGWHSERAGGTPKAKIKTPT